MEQAGGDPLESLETDLNTWRKTAFDRLLVRRDSLPALREAARRAGFDTSKGRWQEQVRAFLVSVVAAHGQPTGTSGKTNAIVNNPAAIREIFGLTPESRDASVATRLDHAGKQIGNARSGHTLRRDLRGFADQVAIWIRAYLDEQALDPDQTEPAGEDAHLISREDDLAWLRDTYRALLERRGGLFQLWGIAGVGKTTLARAFSGQIGPEHAVGVVRVGRRGLFENDVRSIVRREGVDESGLSDAHCLAAFRKLVATYRKSRPLRLLIFDGADSPEQVIELVPLGVAIPTLITTRERLVLTDDIPAQPRDVSGRRMVTFGRDQSVQLLRRLAPELDKDMALKLAEAVGGHPESLAHVGRCLGLPDVTASELLEDLSRRPRQALISMTHALDVSDCAAGAIEELLRHLDTQALAYQLLISLIWAEEFGQLPTAFALELVTELRGERPSGLSVRAALRRLEQLGLLGESRDSLYMSRLTCQVLRDLTMWTAAAPVLLAYERLLATDPPDPSNKDMLTMLRLEYGFGRPLGEEIAEFFPSDRPPAFICVDARNWALFTSDKWGRRSVTLYRITGGALLCFDTLLRSGWEVIPADASGGIVRSAERYYELVGEGWKRLWPAEKWQRAQEGLLPITGRPNDSNYESPDTSRK